MWQENQATTTLKAFGTEMILKILECAAEDELFRDTGVEYDQLERFIRQYDGNLIEDQLSQSQGSLQNSPNTLSKPVHERVSIFTIDEEERDDSCSSEEEEKDHDNQED